MTDPLFDETTLNYLRSLREASPPVGRSDEPPPRTLTALVLHHPNARPLSEARVFTDPATAAVVALDHDNPGSMLTVAYQRHTFGTALRDPYPMPGEDLTDAWKMTIFAHPAADRSQGAILAALMRYIGSHSDHGLVRHHETKVMA